MSQENVDTVRLFYESVERAMMAYWKNPRSIAAGLKADDLDPAVKVFSRRTAWSFSRSNARIWCADGGGNSSTSSNRRQTARSSRAGWLVAATRTLGPTKLSSCCKNAVTTRFSSPWSVRSARSLPIASNSSKRTTQGSAPAASKIEDRFFDVSPRKDDTTVDRFTVANCRPSSSASASAVADLPHPGGPVKRNVRLGGTPVGH
jgi:hypothetical protein